MSSARRADVGGFTLLEVLVALAVVTFGMAALLSTLNSAASTTSYLQDKTLAEWIALNQVSKTRLQSTAPSKGDTDGETDYAGRKWKWAQNVDDSQIPGVLKVEVKVRPTDVRTAGDNAWFADVTGVVGDAVGAPRGDLPSWSTTANGAPGGAGSTSSSAPATPGALTPPQSPFNPSITPPVPQQSTTPTTPGPPRP